MALSNLADSEILVKIVWEFLSEAEMCISAGETIVIWVVKYSILSYSSFDLLIWSYLLTFLIIVFHTHPGRLL